MSDETKSERRSYSDDPRMKVIELRQLLHEIQRWLCSECCPRPRAGNHLPICAKVTQELS